MHATRTGNFPIGFRVGGGAWQRDLGDVITWAKANGFASLDVGALPEPQLRQILDAGLKIGSVDLPHPWDALGAADPATREAAAQHAAAYIAGAARLGIRNVFAVMFPEDDAAPRHENLERLADGYRRLCAAIEPSGARIVLEGYPGRAPHYPAFGCTPADLRLLFERIPSNALGINFDPSHLIRLGIDPVRFCEEFAPRIHHVHGKDTELLADGLYEHGNLQPATLDTPHGFGGHAWRYTLPGHGVARWTRLLTLLADAGYDGHIAIELEDENFNGTEDGEKRGLLAARDFLTSA